MHWIGWEKLVSPKVGGGLGFRDLHSFNMAMLAKQAWRLLHNPTSLGARLLKAKYYPNSSVMKAEAKQGCSYTWRSICLGIQTLNEGIIWRVGGGKISIFGQTLGC